MKGKTRRTVVVLAVVAMIAGLLAIPALPAGAAGDGKASNPAEFTACPAGTIPAAGFTDTATSFAMADIDCIAYYGVTKGTSATTYDPASAVTREQMALFLVRAAGPAGITLGAGADQGFTDISGLSAESQTAINQLAELGVTKGTSATTYGPAGAVTREQMALFLARFLDKLSAAIPGGDRPKDVTPDDAPFTDITGVTFEGHDAILDLYELGVTTGTTATTFSPSLSVSREQMAAFISRTLGHSNAKPAGVTMQAVPTSGFAPLSVDVLVSYRDASFMPAANVLIDIFELDDPLKDAFKTDGTCTADVTATTGPNECKIDLLDSTTDAMGNIALNPVLAGGDDISWWAWTGAVGATFDADTVTAGSASAAATNAATTLEFSSSSPKYTTVAVGTPAGPPGALAPYGTVTWTAQATDGTKDVAKSGVTVQFFVDRYEDGVFKGTSVMSAKTDATGAATFTFTESDPKAAPTSNSTSFVTYGYSNTGALGFDFSALPDFNIVFDDDAAAKATVVAGQSSDYTEATDVGSGAASTATGTVYDQYGRTMSGVSVAFTSNDAAGIGAAAISRFTNSSGVASLSYNRDDATTNAELFTVDITADTDSDTHYWVDEAGATPGGPYAVLVWDGTNDGLVFYDGADYLVAYYDSNDQLNLAGTPKSFADFDKAVGKEPLAGAYNDVTSSSYASTASGISNFNLTP